MDASSHPSQITRNRLPRNEVLGLRDIFNHVRSVHSEAKGMLLVCLDIKGYPTRPTQENAKYSIGISILDTHNLDQSDPSPIQSQHFVVGSENYYKQTSWSFAFGNSIHLTLPQIRERIEESIGGREYVLVVHCRKDIFRLLKAADITIQPLRIIDTQQATRRLPDLDSRCSLQEMLSILDIPYTPEMLTKPGNNANFTLRAMLLLIVLDARNHLEEDRTPVPSAQAARLSFDYLAGLAKDHVPLGTFEQLRQAEEKRQSRTALARRIRRNEREVAQKAISKRRNLPTEEEVFVLDQLVARHGLKNLWLQEGEVLEADMDGVGEVREEHMESET